MNLSTSPQFTSETIFTTESLTITVGRTEGSGMAVDTDEGQKWGSARLSSAWGVACSLEGSGNSGGCCGPAYSVERWHGSWRAGSPSLCGR